MGISHWKASGLPLTQERLKQFLSYDPDTGRFDWLVTRPGRKAKHDMGAGERAHNGGGRTISVDGVNYSTGQLAWFYFHGEWPTGDIYHRDGNRHDDRIANLEDSGRIIKRPRDTTSAEMTADRLRSLVRYEPETGNFFWRERSGRLAGKTKAGTLLMPHDHEGYAAYRIERYEYRGHRLAWLYMTGNWPPPHLVIDHIDGKRDNNKWANLRLATRSQNAANTVGRSTRKSPLKGAYQRPDGRWTSSIALGVFDTPEEAHEAYMKAARLFFGEFARGS